MVTNSSEPAQSDLKPSSSLHTKLQTIVDNAHRAASERGRNDDYTVMLIEQAFQEAGYIKLNVKPGDIIAVNAKTYSLNGNGTITEILHMTGQEFYDRFKAETESFKDSVMDIDYHDYIEAARRAAGLA